MQRDQQTQEQVSRRMAVRSVGGAALAGAVLGAHGAGGAARADSGNPALVGTWLVTLPGQTRNLSVLMFFFASGIVQLADAPQTRTQRTDDPDEAYEQQSISGGQWLQTGFNEYAFTLLGLDYDPRGNLIAIDTTRGTITFDPLRDRWTAASTITETDPNGTPTAGGARTGTMTARRVGVTP